MKRISNAVREMAEKVKAPQPSGPDPWRKGWQRRKQSRMRNNARPEPLSPQRKRPLTADGINTKCANKTKDQDQSLLFSRLPIDIRRLIYQEVLASPDHQELHIISSNKRLICHRCDMDDPETPNWAHKCWGETAVDGTSIDWMEEGLGPQQVGMEFHTPVVMGLLCSCRRIYSESIGILYSDNIFNFRQTRTITDFKATILPQRLEEIRSLHLGCPLEAFWDVDVGTQVRKLYAGPATYPGDICFYWIPAWEAIKGMKGLKNLRVSLWQFERPREPDMLPTIDKLIELFKSVVGVDVPNFHVEFFWPVNIEELRQGLNGNLSCSFEVKDVTVSPK